MSAGAAAASASAAAGHRKPDFDPWAALIAIGIIIAGGFVVKLIIHLLVIGL